MCRPATSPSVHLPRAGQVNRKPEALIAGSGAEVKTSYLVAGRLTDARRHALAALEMAPMFERAQELLLKVVDGREP